MELQLLHRGGPVWWQFVQVRSCGVRAATVSLTFANFKTQSIPNRLASDMLIICSRCTIAFKVGTSQADMSNFWAMTTLSTKSNGIFSKFFIAVARIFWNCHIVASFSTDVHSWTLSGSLWDSLGKETQWIPNCYLFTIPSSDSDLQLKHNAKQLDKICFLNSI